jgi:phosphoglycolate phosphatase
MTRVIQTVLFDLDGTLADTAPDMAFALNQVLNEEDLPSLPLLRVRNHVSHGTAHLIRLGFGEDQADNDYRRRIKRFLDIYQARLCADTILFPGMPELLARLESLQLNWGVVTNKPGWLTNPLMEQLGLHLRSACTISGDTTAERKPHPLPMLTAAKLAGSDPQQCLYLGDAERDIQAGHAAKMSTLIAAWGYIDEQQQPQQWGADGTIAEPLQTLQWLQHRSHPQAGTL